MVKVVTNKAFYDLKAHVDRMPGDVFEVTEARAAQLDAALPGYVSAEKSECDDLTRMTLAKLVQLARERGIAINGRPTKARLIEILSKE